MTEVAIILTLIWALFLILIRKKIASIKVLFAFLFMMLLPSWLEMYFLKQYIPNQVNYFNIFIFGMLLVIGSLPWLSFDKYLLKNKQILVNQHYIKSLKIIFILIIICSLFSIAYLIPYSIDGIIAGAADRRIEIKESGILPENFLTTFVVGIAALNIYNILFFFISCLDERLKKFRIWLLISSMSYIFNCMAFTARDGLIILPLFYIIFYIIFRNSIDVKLLKHINKILAIALSVVAVILIAFTLSRFYADKNLDEFFNGTLGYIAQQPYVFDSTVQLQKDYHGFELRFPLINRLLGIEKYDIDRSDNLFETQFGTMYSEFYSIGGWWSLILVTLIYVFYYSLVMVYLKKHNKYFGILLLFTVYLYIETTGLFYCKAGSTVLINIFYIALSILPLFINNYIIFSNGKVRYNYSNH